MSLPAMTNQSASHRGIANQIDTTTRFCNAQVIKNMSGDDAPGSCSQPVRRPAKAAVGSEFQKTRVLQRLQNSRGLAPDTRNRRNRDRYCLGNSRVPGTLTVPTSQPTSATRKHRPRPTAADTLRQKVRAFRQISTVVSPSAGRASPIVETRGREILGRVLTPEDVQTTEEEAV